MRKFFYAFSLICALFVSQSVFASSTTYYAKATVDVAEESTGMGSVYLLNANEEVVDEVVNTGAAIMSNGQYVSFNVRVEANEGYELVNFTDDEGKEYEYGNGYVSVYSTATDEANPAVFHLHAHFALATAIDNVAEEQKKNDKIFNVAGQQLNKLKKGLNITNGKKILVK